MPLLNNQRPSNNFNTVFVFLLCFCFSIAGYSQQEKQDTTGPTKKEGEFYNIATLQMPERVIVGVGGMTF